MRRQHFLWLFLISYGVLLAHPAQAYLLPLIGAGGVIATAIAGIIAMLFSAAFLIFFKIRRFMRRRRKTASEKAGAGSPEPDGT